MAFKKSSILFYLAVSPLGYLLLTHLHHVLLPFNLVHKEECRNTNQLLETYSAPGFHQLLDRIVCVLVRFCNQAINDPMCFPLTATLVGLATTSYTVMSVERVRLNNNQLLAPIMICFGNVIGTGVIAPMAWLPIYGWSLSSHASKQVKAGTQHKTIRAKIASDSSKNYIEPSKIFGIAIAALFGQFLPVAILVSFGSSLTQRNILALFQYFPLVYGLLEFIVPLFAKELNCKTKKGSTDSIRLLYVAIASINTFLSFWVWIKWLHTTPAPDQFVKQWIDLFFSFGATKENPVAYMLMWDIVALFSTFTYWAWLEDGLDGVKTIVKNSILFGPGSGLAIYAMKREARI